MAPIYKALSSRVLVLKTHNVFVIEGSTILDNENLVFVVTCKPGIKLRQPCFQYKCAA